MLRVLFLSLCYLIKSLNSYSTGWAYLSATTRMNRKYFMITTSTESDKSLVYIVEPLAEKKRLDSYLSALLPRYSRSYFADLCDKGKVTVNSIPKNKNYKVSSGDTVSFALIEKEISRVTPENIPLDILYEDDYIIAINKPAGMVVHPAVGSPNGTFVNALLYHLGSNADCIFSPESSSSVDESLDDDGDDDEVDLDDLPETPEAAVATPMSIRPGIVHRLDKGTSGVLLAGKTLEAVAKLSSLFAQRKVRKVYLSINVGHPGDATIVEPIGRSTKNRQQMTVYDGPPGKPASTHIRTLAFDGKISAALVRIETGRTHQIRVHLKHRHTPIIGDETYGVIEWNRKYLRSHSIRRPMLHAYETEFTHPFTGDKVTITAPVPADVSSLLSRLNSPDDAFFDTSSGLLTCTTDVRGKGPGEAGRGFVPSDRLVMDDEDWTSIELPEVMP